MSFYAPVFLKCLARNGGLNKTKKNKTKESFLIIMFQMMCVISSWRDWEWLA